MKVNYDPIYNERGIIWQCFPWDKSNASFQLNQDDAKHVIPYLNIILGAYVSYSLKSHVKCCKHNLSLKLFELW